MRSSLFQRNPGISGLLSQRKTQPGGVLGREVEAVQLQHRHRLHPVIIRRGKQIQTARLHENLFAVEPLPSLAGNHQLQLEIVVPVNGKRLGQLSSQQGNRIGRAGLQKIGDNG